MHKTLKDMSYEKGVSEKLLADLEKVKTIVDGARDEKIDVLFTNFSSFIKYLDETNSLRTCQEASKFIKDTLLSFICLRKDGIAFVPSVDVSCGNELTKEGKLPVRVCCDV
jgi:hypothetical protein